MDQETLKQRMGELQNRISQNSPFWDHHSRSLVQHILDGEDPTRFLLWPEVENTMFVGDCKQTRMELRHLETVTWWGLPYLREPGFGNAKLIEGSYLSGNVVHQAYHLYSFEHKTGKSLADFDSFYEFGGGYGVLAMMMRSLGWKGEYKIVDLPCWSVLQEYYLSNVGVEGINFIPKIVPTDKKQVLFIASFSLSEVPIAERPPIVKAIDEIHPTGFLFAFQGDFEKTDNHAWFSAFASDRPEYKWTSIEPNPYYGYYLFGTRE